MGTTGWESDCVPRIFTGRRERTGRPGTWGALPAIRPYLRAIRFQGRLGSRRPHDRGFFSRLLRKKLDRTNSATVKRGREPRPGPPPASPGSFALPRPRRRPHEKKKRRTFFFSIWPSFRPHPSSGILTRFPFDGRCIASITTKSVKKIIEPRRSFGPGILFPPPKKNLEEKKA